MPSSPVIYPPLINVQTAEPVVPRSEDYVEAVRAGSTRPWGEAALAPLGWNQGRPDGSRMVGWTLHLKGKSAWVQEHAFSINPQAITRTDSPRNQMFATQAAFYVDDFGPGPIQIQLNQLVAHGRGSGPGGGDLSRATMRDDVLRFYDLIYLETIKHPGKYDVYFHDNHFWAANNSKSPERVYFPPNSCQLIRSVSQNNVWQLQLMMATLSTVPAASTNAPQVPGQPRVRTYIVRKGDTLTKLGARLAGRGATHQRVHAMMNQIIALTRKYGQDDITKKRALPIYDTHGVWTGARTVAGRHLAVGEKIILPAG